LSPHFGAGFALAVAEGVALLPVVAAVADGEADVDGVVVAAVALPESVGVGAADALGGDDATEAADGGAGTLVVGAGVADESLFLPHAAAARAAPPRAATKDTSAIERGNRVIGVTIATPRASLLFSRAVPGRTLVETIARKRDGGRHDPGEIARLVAALGAGELADYQMAAWLMAVYFRGLDDAETVELTEAMLHSGRVLDLSSVTGIKVDKHSTGGVGDKVSIALAPLVAACGVPVPMVSGRGLGHTGGTLDKLEAIPGFRTQLSAQDFARIVGDVGCCMIGQTSEIAPADKRIYALRDVTATVECIPLIVASILSKKLAEGIDALVLDVKVGSGAFMKDEARARELASALVRVGTRAGKRVVTLLTDMEAPLGAAVGNAIETREALDVLAGGGPADLVECTMRLGEEMLVLGGRARDATEARAKLADAIADGTAARAAERMIEAQGGDARVVADRGRLQLAPVEVVVEAPRDGFVARADALVIGLTAVAMGAGRTRADQAVDHGVGISVEAKPGQRVTRGQPLARLHLRSRDEALVERLRGAFAVADSAPAPRPLVLGRIT
jgi:pyrimidine-nucleoside phosphorylase